MIAEESTATFFTNTSPTLPAGESETWKKFKNGDKQALSDLYHTYYPSLFQYGRKLCGDEVLTEDCIQDLFFVLWKNRNSLDDVRSVKAYMYKSFRGKLFRMIKKSRSGGLRLLHPETYEGEPEQSWEDIFIHQQSTEEQQARLRKALEKLSSRQKEIMYLRFYKELSYEEIAEVVPLSYQSIRNCVHASLKTLRKLLLTAGVVIGLYGWMVRWLNC
jgi:RNA polymerase sigma factor (sigma-70 family)